MKESIVGSLDTEISNMTDEEMLAEEPVDSEVQPMGRGSVADCLGAVLGIDGDCVLQKEKRHCDIELGVWTKVKTELDS